MVWGLVQCSNRPEGQELGFCWNVKQWFNQNAPASVLCRIKPSPSGPHPQGEPKAKGPDGGGLGRAQPGGVPPALPVML